MTSAPSYNQKGTAGEGVPLPEKVFKAEVNPVLLAQAVRVYLVNQRKAGASTKTRGMVAKTTAKMYKQKGTGRARHGSYAAPIFVGGGVAFGPSGDQNYARKLPKKMTKAAVRGALSAKTLEKRVVVVNGWEKGEAKTKPVAKLIEKAGWKGRILLISGGGEEGIRRGWRNIEKVTVTTPDELNPYLILAHSQVLITPAGLMEIKEKYAS